VAEFALALDAAGVGLPASVDAADSGGASAHLAFARRTADDLLTRATTDSGGLMWVQAEHRVRPEFLVAQTGYMQGAAGIGMMLLHLDARLTGRESPRIVFPDTPY
jgi:hypothetical protein